MWSGLEPPRPPHAHAPDAEPSGPVKVLKCDNIQALLFDYMARELGPAQSDLVREHLRKCPACQAAAAEMETTLALLKTADARAAAPAHLSADRRKHLMWAVTHPILDWMARHHVLTSTVATVLVLFLAWLALRRLQVEENYDDVPTFTVSINRMAATNDAPALRPEPAEDDK